MKKGAKVWSFIAILTVVMSVFSGVVSADSSYDPQAAINYAEIWWNGRNPAYHVYGTFHEVPSGELEYGHEYRWNMQAHGSGGWSSVSNTLYFQTLEAAPDAPTITSPGSNSAPGLVIDDLTPTLQWNAVSGVGYYALAIREDPPNGPIVYNPQQVYGTSHSVPSGKLKHGHEYRWNMQAHGSGGWSPVSNTLYFQTSEAPPNYANPPTHVSPSNGKTEVSLTPTFKWNSVSGADYYGLYISEPPYGESNLVYNGIVYGTSFNLPADKKLQHGVKYYWNMASHNSAGWSYDRTDGGKKYSDSWYFTTKSAQPTGSIIVTTNLDQSAFTITGPKTYQGSGKSWSTSDSPDGTYTITFGDVSGYITPSSETKILSAGGSITFGGTYIAVQPPTVETRDATDITETEATINGMITDDGGASIDERRFDWGTTSSCSDGYTNSITVSGNSFSYRLTGLQPGTKYYFRAGAKNSAGWGYGNVLSFTTSQSSATVSSPPRNLRVNEVGDGYVKITWDPPSSDGGSSVTNYKIYRGTSSGAETLYYTTSTAGTTFNNCDNIVNGVTYYYKVKAVNAVGDSDFSNEVSATPISGTSTPCFDGQICYSTKEEAVSYVPSHVVPGDCFVWNDGPSGYPWRVIPGTGCAHWVAHQLGIRRGATCYERYSIRVSDVIYGRTEVEINSCKVGDIWTNSDRTHCGIVRQLGNGEVFVEHDSSVQGGVVKSWFSLGKCWTLQPNQPPICAIELRMEGAKIDEIDVGEFFDIYVRDSTDDTGISEVCFSSDESQDDNPTGEWTEWYDWDTSSGDWDADTNIKKWSFDTGGAKEVWAEVKDEAGQTSKCSANIYANPLIPQSYAIIVAGQGRWWAWGETWVFDHCANNAYRVLRNLGFDDDHIFYLNSRSPHDIDGDGDDEVDELSLLNNFTNVVFEIKDKMGDNPTPFILYLVGHGQWDPDYCFIFDVDAGDQGYLWDSKLQEELDMFPSETPMLIVIGSCYSGGFITSTEGISAENRIIITAATAEDPKRNPFAWARSSDRFWGNLNKGLNVKDAFITDAGLEWWDLWLDDNGDRGGSPPNDLGEDGNLAARTQIGVPGTENLKLTPWIFVWKRSPGELRVYDSQNQVTGLVNGEVKEEIPDSIYDEQDEIVALFSPSDTYRYEVAGTDEGTYGLDIASIKGAEATIFTATDIPTSTNAIHQYTIDWAALSQGEKGVTVKIDSNGNGVERTIITNNSFYPLIAEFTLSPKNPLIGEKVTLDASTSFDLGGGVIMKYRWEFYNAANQDPFHVIEGHDKEIIRYTFTSEGIYRVRLTVTDDEGEYSYTESSITIKESIKEPVFYVPDDYPSIQAAVDAANAGDTIIVRNGTYTENVDIDKSITLKSSSGNPGNTIVQAANPNDHIFEITADYVNICGFSVGGVAVCIFLNEGNYCNISNNHFLNNTGEGILLDSSKSNTVFNNTFSGDSLYSRGICVNNSTNNLILDNTISNYSTGIALYYARNNTIFKNSCKNNWVGIILLRSNDNIVSNNVYRDNNIGIRLKISSGNNTIANNICENNKLYYGISLDFSSNNNTITGNIVSKSNGDGISLCWDSSDNIISGNNVSNNNGNGISLRYSSNNNHIYLNNFIDNTASNVYSEDSTNIWNSKEKITYSYNGESHTNYLGNYWSDYTGSDANKNGIGDSPYGIDDCGGDIDQDYYPLMTWSEDYTWGDFDESNKATCTNTIGMEFVLIPAGEFEMGSPSDEEGRWSNEGPVHHVTIENSFYMGKYEVTQKQWREIIGENPSWFEGDNLPVEQVSWVDVQEFIRKLNEKEGTDKYRLPSEAEWEYACRAGTITRYSFGDDDTNLGDYVWTSDWKTHPVGQKKPNSWELYDMHGSVWEWVQDSWHSSYSGAPVDGSAWENGEGAYRVRRGGGWNRYPARICRSADRGCAVPGCRGSDIGFRLLKEQ